MIFRRAIGRVTTSWYRLGERTHSRNRGEIDNLVTLKSAQGLDCRIDSWRRGRLNILGAGGIYSSRMSSKDVGGMMEERITCPRGARQRGYRHEDCRLSVQWPLVERLGTWRGWLSQNQSWVLNELFKWWCWNIYRMVNFWLVDGEDGHLETIEPKSLEARERGKKRV